MSVLVPAEIEGTKKLSRVHKAVGKDVVADAPVPAVDRNTIAGTAGQGKEEQGHCHEDGDSRDRQVESEHSEGLTSTASHAASEEAALGADGGSSCPKHDMALACLSSSEVKGCLESSHMTRKR